MNLSICKTLLFLLLLLTTASLIRAQDHTQIYLVHLDSVLTYSQFGQQAQQLTDSLEAYWTDSLNSAIETFKKDYYDLQLMIERCCSCTSERIQPKVDTILARARKLEFFATQIEQIDSLIKAEFLIYTKEKINQLFQQKQWLGLVIDYSQHTIFPAPIGQQQLLTNWCIQQLNKSEAIQKEVLEFKRKLCTNVEAFVTQPPPPLDPKHQLGQPINAFKN